MPNQPRADNPARPIRFGRDLWDDVERYATEDDTTASAIVREAVRQYANHRNKGAAR